MHIDRARILQENGTKTNTYTHNQEETVEIYWTRNEEGELEKINTQRAY